LQKLYLVNYEGTALKRQSSFNCLNSAYQLGPGGAVRHLALADREISLESPSFLGYNKLVEKKMVKMAQHVEISIYSGYSSATRP